ncbi:MAG: D-alanyl-D-alanine carboxypeptidase [Alphaproteobacteria bacterium]|nr:D-alanyl-D-alanine carboxypeptidase [Alphaproteobacteria bacterium]NCQ88010.1 D-alanyl-D-alanine carboxypeptidase [Alphaproteobacteria bacterium]NCT05483.1 D-alanyl-D-alanine carboxypeptidase [Alphaproteobacteria bacterium]
MPLSRFLSGFLMMTVFIIVSQSCAHAVIEIPAKQAILLDDETGQVLFKKDHKTQMPTSSMSKVMTMYMVFDALQSGKITMDTEFTVSEKAWRKGGSKMFVGLNENVKISDLIKGVIVQSGNDATIVLAEGLAGTEENFADAMNVKAKEIGMENSNFTNASGWPDPNHYSTVYDLAILAKRIHKDFPEYSKFYTQKEFEYNGIKQPNRNPLLYKDIGATGLKTGHTDAGGYGLIGTAKKNGRSVTMVVNGLSNERERGDIAEQIITWGLNSFENKELYKAGDEVAAARIAFGKQTSVPLTVRDTLFFTLPKKNQKDIKISVHYQSPLRAPIQAGKEVATLKISIPDMGDYDYPLYTANDVEQLGFFKRALANAKHLIFSER